MSRHFKAVKIFTTTQEAESTYHDGRRYVNEGVPIGTILALCEDGELYQEIGSFRGLEWNTPFPAKLFRDYWRIALSDTLAVAQGKPASALSPHSRSILNVLTTAEVQS